MLQNAAWPCQQVGNSPETTMTTVLLEEPTRMLAVRYYSVLS